MRNPSISVKGLGKRYRLGQREPYKTLRDAVTNAVVAPFRHARGSSAAANDSHAVRPTREYIWALRNVSFEIPGGEAVGIIGPNGAGKTTLLKILSRITEPTEGMARVRGRVGSLLEVGTGFHFELTGRENVYLNGAILGMRKNEIDRRFDEIVKFTEIEKFIDTPVKRYSDGMRVRLGFAVAAHLQPEILLVDEVLAVGDAAFQRKCLSKMGDVVSEGRTVLLVSHNMASIQSLCTQAFALSRGTLFASGDVNDVIARYIESIGNLEVVSVAERTDRRGNGRLRFVGLAISGAANPNDIVQCGAPVTFELTYEGRAPLRNVVAELLFYDQYGNCLLVANSGFVGKQFEEIPERGSFLCHFDNFPFMPGVYHLRLCCDVNGIEADNIKNAATIQVVEGDFNGSGKLPPKGWGHIAVPHDWDVRATVQTESGVTER